MVKTVHFILCIFYHIIIKYQGKGKKKKKQEQWSTWDEKLG